MELYQILGLIAGGIIWLGALAWAMWIVDKWDL